MRVVVLLALRRVCWTMNDDVVAWDKKVLILASKQNKTWDDQVVGLGKGM